MNRSTNADAVLSVPMESSTPSSVNGVDVWILYGLVGVLLFGPYLPHVPFLPIAGRFRLDNILFPTLTLYYAFRWIRTRPVTLATPLLRYGLFFAWLATMTVIMYQYAGKRPLILPSPTALLAGMESYARPLMALFIATQCRIGERHLRNVIWLVLVGGIPLHLLAAFQLAPPTQIAVNKFIYAVYSNDRSIWAPTAQKWIDNVTGDTRATSVFGQISTYGMYCLLCVGLLGMQGLGCRVIRSKPLFVVTLLFVALGALASRSKVMTGGVMMLFVFYALLTPILRRLLRLRNLILIAILAGICVMVVPHFYREDNKSRSIDRLYDKFDPTRIWDEYLKTRFGYPEGKIWRTGGMEVISERPWTGAGFTVVHRTTDTFLLGIVMMGGAIGAGLFLWFLFGFFWSLLGIIRGPPTADQTDTARRWTLWTLCAAAGAIYALPHIFDTTVSLRAASLMVLSLAIPFTLSCVYLLRMIRDLHAATSLPALPVSSACAVALLFLGFSFFAASIGFHTFIQDRAGDIYWLLAGVTLTVLPHEHASPDATTAERHHA